MAENQYVMFLKTLIAKTKEKQLTWYYLDTNKELYSGMNWVKTSFYSSDRTEPDFNTEDSFYAKSGNMYIVIHVIGNNPASLYVIPSTFKKIVYLSADEYGEYITRLLNIVQTRFPNAEQFIKDFSFVEITEV